MGLTLKLISLLLTRKRGEGCLLYVIVEWLYDPHPYRFSTSIIRSSKHTVDYIWILVVITWLNEIFDVKGVLLGF